MGLPNALLRSGRNVNCIYTAPFFMVLRLPRVF